MVRSTLLAEFYCVFFLSELVSVSVYIETVRESECEKEVRTLAVRGGGGGGIIWHSIEKKRLIISLSS